MYTINKIKVLNLLIALLPLSIIIGNMAINLNVVIICILGLITYKLKIFCIKNKFYQYTIFLFFFYLILTTLINYFPSLDTNALFKENIIKSFFYLRFLILFFVVCKMIEENDLNLKIFFILCAFFSFFVAIDIVIQIIFGKNLIGYPITSNKPSGFFGNEHVAGSYIQKFSIFFIFLTVHKIKNYMNAYKYIFLSSIIFLIIILLTGNRMPFLIFAASFLLYFLIEKKFFFISILSFLFAIIIFLFLKFPIINRMDTQLKNLYGSTLDIIIKAPELFYYNSYKSQDVEWDPNGYLIHFNSGVQLWKKNKIIGNGLKSLPINCEYKDNTTCNTHPHNYFIEIMMDTGLIGLILIYLIFFFSVLKFFKFYFSKIHNNIKFAILPFFLVIFFEFFPLRSTGSFFTTGNAVIIFLFLAIFINIEKIKTFYKI